MVVVDNCRYVSRTGDVEAIEESLVLVVWR